MIASHESVSVLNPFRTRSFVFYKACRVPQVCVLVNTYSKERIEQFQVFVAVITNNSKGELLLELATVTGYRFIRFILLLWGK